MSDGLLEQAKIWEFPCQSDSTGSGQILPQQPTERWKLQQVADNWLLIVGDIPQVSLHLHEAIAFLERRLSKDFNQKLVNRNQPRRSAYIN